MASVTEGEEQLWHARRRREEEEEEEQVDEKPEQDEGDELLHALLAVRSGPRGHRSGLH